MFFFFLKYSPQVLQGQKKYIFQKDLQKKSGFFKIFSTRTPSKKVVDFLNIFCKDIQDKSHIFFSNIFYKGLPTKIVVDFLNIFYMDSQQKSRRFFQYFLQELPAKKNRGFY